PIEHRPRHHDPRHRRPHHQGGQQHSQNQNNMPRAQPHVDPFEGKTPVAPHEWIRLEKGLAAERTVRAMDLLCPIGKGTRGLIVATILVGTGSKMDEVIFQEFKGTGNMELVLSRPAAEARVFPAIDVRGSGTRKEELLIPPPMLESVWKLRRQLAERSDLDAS